MKENSPFYEQKQIFDAHVHMGYFPRIQYAELFYYSPRRIFNVLRRCQTSEFIISSTCAQISGIRIVDIVREAHEIKCLAGSRAHIFFWLSGHLYDADPTMKWMDLGIFEGIKLHECETPWVNERWSDLQRILSIVEERCLPVICHSGFSQECRPLVLEKMAKRFPAVHFNFAHCHPMDEIAKVIARHDNVWTDTAYLPFEEYKNLHNYDWRGRVMFGTDMPVWQSYEEVSLVERYRKCVAAFSKTNLDGKSAFIKFFNY